MSNTHHTSQAISQVTALSPLDGRYAGKLSALRPIMSDALWSATVTHAILHETQAPPLAATSANLSGGQVQVEAEPAGEGLGMDAEDAGDVFHAPLGVGLDLDQERKTLIEQAVEANVRWSMTQLLAFRENSRTLEAMTLVGADYKLGPGTVRFRP